MTGPQNKTTKPVKGHNSVKQTRTVSLSQAAAELENCILEKPKKQNAHA